MHGYINRMLEKSLKKAIDRSPVTAILGPRQCGKSTLAKAFMQYHAKGSVYLDLQDRIDRNKLNEPELFLEQHRSQLVCLDEIQRVPDFFSVLRSEVDKERQPGRFLLLGSASRDLIRQSSESLAGRIEYLNLTPFLFEELSAEIDISQCWLRGGFPDSVLANTDEDSFEWRKNFIRTFLERDIPLLNLSMPIPVIERLWMLLAHYHGQTVNYSKLAEAADISIPSLKKYLSVLEQTYMVRCLPVCERNIKKRMIKAPKIYIRDSGILHALLAIRGFDDLLSHPACGASWEGFAIDNIIASMPSWTSSFLKTSNGAEVDLVMEDGRRVYVFEFKASKAPKASRGFFQLLDDLKPDKAFIVAPVDNGYEYSKNVRVINLPFSDSLQATE